MSISFAGIFDSYTLWTLILAVLWLIFAVFGALLSARPYPHYLQEPVVPFALLVPFIFVAENIWSWLMIGITTGLLILMQKQIKFGGYPTISVYQNYWQYLTKQISPEEYRNRFDNTRRNYEIAEYLADRLGKEEQIYIWGSDPTIYNLTERLPTGGKYIVSFHVHDLAKHDYVMAELTASQPKYVVILPGSTEFAQLRVMLAREYYVVDKIENAEIYMRRGEY